MTQNVLWAPGESITEKTSLIHLGYHGFNDLQSQGYQKKFFISQSFVKFFIIFRMRQSKENRRQVDICWTYTFLKLEKQTKLADLGLIIQSSKVKCDGFDIYFIFTEYPDPNKVKIDTKIVSLRKMLPEIKMAI